MDYPIIEHVTEEKFDHYEHNGNVLISIIRSIGVDKSGVRWTWETATWEDDNGINRIETRYNSYRYAPQEAT